MEFPTLVVPDPPVTTPDPHGLLHGPAASHGVVWPWLNALAGKNVHVVGWLPRNVTGSSNAPSK